MAPCRGGPFANRLSRGPRWFRVCEVRSSLQRMPTPTQTGLTCPCPSWGASGLRHTGAGYPDGGRPDGLCFDPAALVVTFLVRLWGGGLPAQSAQWCPGSSPGRAGLRGAGRVQCSAGCPHLGEEHTSGGRELGLGVWGGSLASTDPRAAGRRAWPRAFRRGSCPWRLGAGEVWFPSQVSTLVGEHGTGCQQKIIKATKDTARGT